MGDIDLKDQSDETQTRTEPHGQRPTKPWDAEIDVYLKSVGPPATFEIETCLPVDSNGNIVFNNAGRPGFNVTFRFYDDTNSGYAFPQGANKQDAVWSQLGSTGCPTTGVWAVFDQNSITVIDQGATLVVRNLNPKPAQGPFRYTLNVTTNGNPPYLPLDPGGSNQNGDS